MGSACLLAQSDAWEMHVCPWVMHVLLRLHREDGGGLFTSK
jgi:hypothetical protein